MTEGLTRGCPPLAIPALETDRLILRGFEPGDAPALAAIQGDAEVVRYLGGVTDETLIGALDRLLIYLGHWSAFGCGKWAVEEKATGRMIGRVGYLDPPYDWPGLELGWTFARDAWGKGYATEAAAAAIDWAFAHLGWDDVIHCIDPANVASQALAQRLGSRNLGPVKLPAPYEDAPSDAWGQSRAEWADNRKRFA